MDPYTLLIIARSQSLTKCLQGALDPDQHLIRWVPSTTQALELDLCPSLMLLDLPPSGGVRCVARLKRRFGAPLLALSRPGLPVPKQVDASLPREHPVEELVELVQTTLMSHAPHIVHTEGMWLDTEARRLQMNGKLYSLRPIACKILALLMARAGEVVPREELFRRVWETEDGDGTRALDVHISYLRHEIERDPRSPTLIVTERGVGYRLRPPA
ncbi:MAG: response regulator transcription factor [Anaerolineae bacterium]|jgi:DNA-binding response OmpR family regulator